jgi:hypothetical protein
MKQNWSRRELEAFGEPLGDSVTQRKLGGGYICGGGGKGGGGTPPPQQSTAYNTNIPEYAKPYVTTMLGATQKQLFEGTPTEGGGYDITGFRPYQPYSTNVQDYFAGFSPMQQQAQQATAGLQTPGQFDVATGLTGLGALGSLGAGQQYAQNVTDPARMQSFMSPYQQGVTDIAKNAAIREAQMMEQGNRLSAARQGTYGGARQTLASLERERNLASNLSNIQAQGSQAAYDRALQSQQFGANLGLQGLGQTIQGAGQMGQLGTAQLGAQQNIIGLQNQMGGQQQALEQAKINQAIQDYATQQQYPLLQLGMMSNMLRGLPMQATTTQTYQAQPAPITQGLGLLAGAAGAKQAGLFAEGGTIKGLASGGVTKYANRGMVQANPDSSVVRGIRSKLEMMSADQLQKVAQTSPSEEIRAMAIQILQEQKVREQAEAQAQQSIAQDQQRGLPTPVTERAGLPAAPAGSMDMLSAASGGIVAFAGPDGSQVDLDENEANRLQQEFLARQQYENFVRKQREAAGVGAPKAALGEFYTKEQAALGDAESKNKGYNLMDIGFNLATQTGSLAQAAGKAGRATLPNIIAREEGLRGRKGDVAKGLAEVAEGERLMKQGDITAANAMFEKAEDRLSKEKIAGSKAPGNMTTYANNYLAEKTAAGDTRDPTTILREGMDQYMYLYGQAGPRAAVAATTATTNIYDKARDNVDSSLAKNFNSPENRELRRLQKEDKKNKTNTANTYLQELYRKEEQRMKGGVPSGGGGGGGGKAPLPPGFQRDKS